MTIKLDVTNDAVVNLDEYLDHVRRNLRAGDRGSLLATAPALCALANNRRFLVDAINDELLGRAGFQPANDYTAQTFLLGRGRGYLVRANVWTPRDADARGRAHAQRPPAAFAISLNLLCVDPSEMRDPLFFDVERGRVAAPVAGASEPRALLCAIAGSIGDGRTSSLFDRSAGARLRLAAARARPAILRYSTGIQVDSRRHPIQKEGRDGPAALTRRATGSVCVYEGSSRMCPRTQPPPSLVDLSAPPSRSPRPSTT